jgi:hypothetical protein
MYFLTLGHGTTGAASIHLGSCHIDFWVDMSWFESLARVGLLVCVAVLWSFAPEILRSGDEIRLDLPRAKRSPQGSCHPVSCAMM